MARTFFLPTDPIKRRAWCATVAQDSIADQYFARMEGDEGSHSPIVRKTDLEKGAGDEVVTTLVAKFRGTPVIEGKRMEGNEFRLSNASHTMRINEFRQGVNIGARIEQSRVGHNLKKTGRVTLTNYISEMYEEVIVMAANGARGIGDEITQFTTDWPGYPNPLRAPDAGHYYMPNAKTKATLVATDTLKLTDLERLRVKVKKMLGGVEQGKNVRIEPVKRNGKEMYILVTMPEAIADIRADAGPTGWFEAQKALIQAIGKEAEAFKGGAGYWNGIMVDEIDRGVRFSDYGAGGNIPAMRSLLLGANAVAIAHGTKGMADGMTIDLTEDTDDRGHDAIMNFELIFGADKCQYNGVDYGMITVDSAFTAAV